MLPLTMALEDTLKKLCFDEGGILKKKSECRAALINHLILEDTFDIDEAEDTADKFMRGSGLWPELQIKWEEDEPLDASTTA